MPKRLTATEKWTDPWFCSLDNTTKIFWIYLLDNCDHAGIWRVNYPLLKFYFGDFVINLSLFNGRIKVLSEDKWFIPKFIEFQYGELNKENRVHASVIHILEKEGACKPLESPMLGCKDKDKDIINKKELKPLNNTNYSVPQDFEDIWGKYPRRDGKKEALKHYIATVKTDKDKSDIQKALTNYLTHLSTNKTDGKYIKMGATWFNNWQDWVNFIEPITEKSSEDQYKETLKKVGLIK